MKKPKAYLARSARARKRVYIHMKNRIRGMAAVTGGLFHTKDAMHPHLRWMSFGFLSGRTVYICALRTASYAYKEKVESAAWHAAETLAPRQPMRRLPGESIGDFMNRREPKFPQLDGLTRLQWSQREEKRIADSGNLSVCEYVKIDRTYRHGILIDAVVNVPYLTVDVVNDFIRKFLLTEQGWCSDVPLTFTYEQIGEWDLEVNTEA